MKKIILVFIILLASCSTQNNYLITNNSLSLPTGIQEQSSIAIVNKIHECLKLSDDKIFPFVYIAHSDEINAWIDDKDNIFITRGFYVFDDKVIMFVLAHEMAHIKLKHLRNRKMVSYATSGAIMIINRFVPGFGWFNVAANPAVTNNFSKTQEYAADKLASEVLISCFNISSAEQVKILQSIQNVTQEGGGFWAQHPSWSERIEAISKPPSIP